MSQIIGYLRTDNNNQNPQQQRDQLKAAGATRIVQELNDADRVQPQFSEMCARLGSGDTVMVTSLDRIACNIRHLREIVDSLCAAEASLRVLDNQIDTATAHGEVLRLLLAALDDFQRRTGRQRQAAGIAQAKREGRYKGRKPSARAKADQVLALNAEGLTRQKIADQLGIGVASVYRILKQQASLPKQRNAPIERPANNKPRAQRPTTRQPGAEQLSLF